MPYAFLNRKSEIPFHGNRLPFRLKLHKIWEY
jgi:hypothetical protein